MRLPPYPKYKSSGVEWLGDVPEHWEVDRLKWTTTGTVNGIWGEEPNGVDDLICVRVADFDRERFLVVDEPPTLRAVDESQREGRLLRKGDLLIEKSGGGEKQLVGCVVFFDHEFAAVCSNFVARMPTTPHHSARFWSYAHASLYDRRLNYPAIKQTTGIQNLDSAVYLDTRVGLPPETEQHAIAAFLDRETAKMDTLVAKKRTLIERLKEKRTALISHAVTRGLPPDTARAAGFDPHPKLKPSGVEWLGEVPEHWEVTKGRFLGRLMGSIALDDDEAIQDEGGIPYAKVDDLNYVDSSMLLKSTKLSVAGLSVRPRRMLLFPKRGAAIFTNKVVIVDGRLLFDSNLMGWEISHRTDLKFVAYCLVARRLDDLADVSTVPQINNKHIYPAQFPRPPLPEQRAIAAFLDRETTKIDTMVANVERAIERLQEYRSTLIIAAVTGKSDVLGAVS